VVAPTTWTISSFWVKRGKLGSGLSSNIFDGIAGNTQNEIQFYLEDSIELYDYSNASRQELYLTNRKFRDTSAWYHIVAVDTTNATAGVIE
jgi:hypothetical protein